MPSLSALAVLFSVACALTLAGSDYFRKAVPSIIPTKHLLFYFLAGQLPLLAAWIALSPDQVHFSALIDPRYWRAGLPDAAASLIGNTLFLVAVRRSPLGLVIPLLALIPVFTLALGAVVLGEWPTARQTLGIVMAAAGVFSIYQPERLPLSLVAIWRNFKSETGARFMVVVALAWAFTAPMDKIALARAGVGLHALIQVSLLALATLCWIIGTERERGITTAFHVPREAAGRLLGAALAGGLAYVFQLVAYQLTAVAFVEALKRGLEMIAVLAIGTLFLKERLTPHKMLGVGLIASGIPLMIVPPFA